MIIQIIDNIYLILKIFDLYFFKFFKGLNVQSIILLSIILIIDLYYNGY